MEGLVTAAVLALTASGLSLVFGIMRIVNLAHGDLIVVGSFLMYSFATTLGSTFAPVTVSLPEMKHISIRTTVKVPVAPSLYPSR